jgi:hypothetical protein
MLHHFAKDMSDEDMSLLNARRAGGGDDKGNICHLCKRTSIVSGEGHCFHPHLFGYLKGFEDIGRVSTGADADGDISFLAEGPELFGEDFIKGKVVGDTGENRSICGEGKRRERRTVHDIAIDEFCGKVLGVGSASPVSEEEEFVPRFEGMRDEFDHFEEFGEILFQKACLYIGAFFKSLQNNIFHRTRILYPLLSPVKGVQRLAHPQFCLIHSGLGEMDVSYPLTNPLFKAS